MLYPKVEVPVELPLDTLHAHLANYNLQRMATAIPTTTWEDDERSAFEYRVLEGQYLETLRSTVKPLSPGYMGTTDNFVNWFESLTHWGAGQQHALFNWLATDATLAQMKWFLTQDAAVKKGFEDLVAFTQVGLPEQCKLECARNFWDEMGRGKQGSTQGSLLERTTQSLKLQPSIDTAVWESLALNNMMLGLATTRRYVYHSLGALGAAELMSSQRAAKVSSGMKRLGLDPWARSYYDLNAALDISHSCNWIREIIRPVVSANPECSQFIAEGALMRLHSDKLCFDRYSHELGLGQEIESCETSSVVFAPLGLRENVAY